MNDLLKLANDGHGGMRRWEQISRFRAAASIAGAIWALKGKPGLLEDVVLDGETRDQRADDNAVPAAGPVYHLGSLPADHRDLRRRDRERRDPAASFAGLTRHSPWDDLQVAYFAGEANWNYFAAPFILARPDFVTEETGPWHEDGQTWRSLLATYPDTIVAHTTQRSYYFDDTGLLRRLDYSVGILGGGPAVHYPSQYREFDGIHGPDPAPGPPPQPRWLPGPRLGLDRHRCHQRHLQLGADPCALTSSSAGSSPTTS